MDDRLDVLENRMLASMQRHEDSDDKRFDRCFDALSKIHSDLIDRMGEIGDDIKEVKGSVKETNSRVSTLWDEKNQRAGAFNLSRWLGHAATGIITLVLAFIGEVVIRKH